MKYKLLIIVILIILLIVLFNNTIFYNFKNSTKKNGLFVLIGECFREGDMGSRLRDTEYGIKTQRIASNSHIKFVEQIKTNYNININIVINTYKTKYQYKLEQWYSNYLLELIYFD